MLIKPFARRVRAPMLPTMIHSREGFVFMIDAHETICPPSRGTHVNPDHTFPARELVEFQCFGEVRFFSSVFSARVHSVLRGRSVIKLNFVSCCGVSQHKSQGTCLFFFPEAPVPRDTRFCNFADPSKTRASPDRGVTKTPFGTILSNLARTGASPVRGLHCTNKTDAFPS